MRKNVVGMVGSVMRRDMFSTTVRNWAAPAARAHPFIGTLVGRVIRIMIIGASLNCRMGTEALGGKGTSQWMAQDKNVSEV